MKATSAGAIHVDGPLLRTELGGPGALRTVIHVAFLIAYVGCTIMLANTANRGGRLVHEAGLRAIVGQAVATASAPAQEQKKGGEDSQRK